MGGWRSEVISLEGSSRRALSKGPRLLQIHKTQNFVRVLRFAIYYLIFIRLYSFVSVCFLKFFVNREFYMNCMNPHESEL